MSPRYRGRHRRFHRVKDAVRILLILLLILFAAWGLIEPKLLQVERTTVVCSDLTSDVGQFRVVYVSDIHMGNWPYLTANDVSGLVTKINEQNADLVILGGDYATDSDGAITFFKSVPTIRATYGVYAVLGDCDRTLPESNLQQLLTVMRTRSITPIVNEVVSVRIGTQNIYLAGIDDLSANADIAGVAAQCKSSDMVIFLAHQPDAITTALNTNGKDGKRNWFDVGLFGHSHGGQVNFLGNLIGAPTVEGSYTSGWYTPNRLSILVSQGVGTVGLPVRLGHYPTLHVITVKSGS